MTYKVGQKGQIVIEKAIRDKLGVKPGWVAVQLLVDEHVQIHFVPPEHNESLAGLLASYSKPELDSENALRKATESAWLDSVSADWLAAKQSNE